MRDTGRVKRDPDAYHGPKPKPGQTVIFCEVDRKHTIWDFTEQDSLKCSECSKEVSRRDL